MIRMLLCEIFDRAPKRREWSLHKNRTNLGLLVRLTPAIQLEKTSGIIAEKRFEAGSFPSTRRGQKLKPSERCFGGVGMQPNGLEEVARQNVFRRALCLRN